MDVKKIVVGNLLENCYILIKDKEFLIVDPGDNSDLIISEVGNLNVLGVLITHHHFDHVGALKEILDKYQVNLFDYQNGNNNYNIGPFSFEIISNPGHTKDSVSFYFEKENTMFVGDFIFKNSIGRCDLPGGNFNEMQTSLTKIKNYSDNIILYPGHGESTLLGDEKKFNPYFN